MYQVSEQSREVLSSMLSSNSEETTSSERALRADQVWKVYCNLIEREQLPKNQIE